MKRGKIETTPNRLSDKSPRGSVSDKSPLIGSARINSFAKSHFGIVEDELAQLPYKEHEIQVLAEQIGIDYETEKDKYLWFLVQVVNLDLPPGWMKEEDPNGIVYYHNPTENVIASKHPMIAKFRSLFGEILENEISGQAKTLALKEKVQQLEQVTETAASPRKPVKELKLDKAKKFKAAATAIAMTTALAHKTHRSETITEKAIPRPVPDQPQSIVDSQKTKEKFNKVKEMLERRRTVQEKKVNEVDNLMKTEDILNMCKQNYIAEYGFCHTDVPPQITQLESYDLVDPIEIIEAARLFNVRSNQPYLFWVLRAYCGLPLPEYWAKVFDANMHREIYYNSCYDVKISVKPCYFYIQELINYIKQEYIKDKEPFLNFSNKMTLCDKLGRQYDVDFAAMIKDIIERQNVERKNYFTYHQKKEVIKDDGQKVTKKRKKDEFNPNYSDAHFIEIANQLGIDLNGEIHLLMIIEDYVRGRELEERWFFRQVQEGPSFWVNHEQQKAVNRYPHLNELKKIIDEARNSYKSQSGDPNKHIKSEFNLIKALFRKYPEQVAKKMLQDEAKGYLEFFLKMKNDGQINNINLETKGYNLTNLMRKIGMHLSKSDVMDLLFYCPFDFTQFIGEDFLKSSENFLLRKINLRNGGDGKKGPTEEDEYEARREGSFDSQGSNDSAKHIKSKIEDSKKLLDLASNIKGLTLDPEKKREFMKLLIDFDQKYGDRDLVDALEQDIAENIQEGAASAKGLAKSIKNKMSNSINGKFEDSIGDMYPGGQKLPRGHVESSRESSREKNRNDPNEPEENFPYGRIRRIGDILTDAGNSSKINARNKQDDKDTPTSGRNGRLNRKKVRADGTDGGADQDGDDTIYSAGLTGDAKNRRDKKDKIRRTNSKYNNTNSEESSGREEAGGSARVRRKGEGYVDNEKERRHKKRKNKNANTYENEIETGQPGSGSSPGARVGKKQGKKKGNKNRNKFANGSRSESSNALDDLNEEEEESEDEDTSDEYSDISESESEYDDVTGVSYRTGKSGKKKKAADTLGPSSKYVYDENGKIIFTNRRTQKLLEELAEEEFRLSSRHQYKKPGDKSAQGSFYGDDNDKSALGARGPNLLAFGDHKIVYHEVIMENGEKKIMAINVKPKPRRDRRRSNTMSPDTLDNLSRSPNISGKATPIDVRDNFGKLSRNASKKRLAAEVNQSRDEERGLPMVVGSSFKPPIQARNDAINNIPKFDPTVLIESLNRYNVEALDEAYYKEERKKEELESMQRLSYGDDSKIGDATGLSHSRSLMTPMLRPKLSDPRGREPIKVPQTYRNLASGTQNLEVIKNKNKRGYEKNAKQGVWTHVEVFELKEGLAEQFKEKHNRAASETLKAPVSARTNNNSPRYGAVADKTFFTPFRQGNLGVKRFIEYMSYLNTLVFMKKLDTLITNFLMKQFAAIQQNALGINFNPNDPTFRSMFKKRYHKLIKQLKENLLKKKDFLNNIYTKVFNSNDELPDAIFHSVQNLRDASNNKEMYSAKPSPHQSFMVGQNSRANSSQKTQLLVESGNKPPRSSSLKASQSQQNLQLPKVSISKRAGIDPFRLSQKGFHTPRVGSDENLFADNNIRNTEGANDDIALQNVQDQMSKTRRGNFTIQTQREMDTNNILKSMNDHDQENYRHYWNILGDPLKLESSAIFSRTNAPQGIQPYHVLLMARRLGLQVQNSQEHDLVWIAYLALTVKLPMSNEVNLMITSPKDKLRYQKVCNMKPGEHPGDKYFKTVLVYNQLRRRILFENMSEEDQTKYIKAQSWIKLKEENGGVFYHNFMTKQKTINLPTDMKDIASKVASLSTRSDIKEKLILTNQTIMENDHLLTFFKSKLSVH